MSDRLRTQLENASNQIISFGIGVVEAIIVLVVAWAIHHWLRRPIRRRLAASSIRSNAGLLIENGITVLIYLVAFTFLLALWGVTWAAVFAAISVSTIIVGLGLQDLLKSFAAGIFILFEQPFTLGDEIQVRGTTGRVVGIGLRKTTLQVESGDLVTAPNSILFTDLITNQSPYRTVRTTVTVSDISRTPGDLKTQVAKALQDVPGLASTPEITVRLSRGKRKSPRRVQRFEELEARARVLVQSRIAHGTQVRVSWTGSGQPAVRDEVVKRLKTLFPEATVRAHRG
jgi:small-conductance mechanosensitive channel